MTRILYLAGTWNIIGGASALADHQRHFAQLYSSALSLQDRFKRPSSGLP
jgi:hypothetical protein